MLLTKLNKLIKPRAYMVQQSDQVPEKDRLAYSKAVNCGMFLHEAEAYSLWQIHIPSN